MTVRTIEVKVYTYDALSESAKEKAREWYSSNLDYQWWDSVYDDFECICDILGVDLSTHTVRLMSGDTRRVSNIWFSGFYHQGGGSSFDGTYGYKKGAHKAIREYAPMCEALHGIADRLLTLQKANFYRVTGTISNSGRYNSLSVDAFLTDYVNGGSDFAETNIDNDLTDIIGDLNNYLYSSLEREYEHLTSDDVVEDSIIANKYEFNEDGSVH